MVTTPSFYNLKDQGIYSAGDFFIPQEKYRAAPYTVNKSTNDPNEVPAGIPAIYQSQGGGGGGFNPYNTDMSSIRQDYNAFPSRQAGEIYSKTFNPQPFAGGLDSAQDAYNYATKGINLGYGNVIAKDDPNLKMYRGDKSVFQMQKDADDIIQDEKMRYATEGQYVDPYDPNYSSMTEARKFMDNYPDYYYGPPKTGLEQLASKAINFIPGIGTVSRIAGFLSSKLPINERAIMENEARGAGIFTDDIGRIVTDDYNTAGGIMAGYNLNQIDSGTFDKRRSTIEKTIADKKAKGLDTTTLEERLGLLDKAEEDILGARKKTQQIYKMRADKRAADKKRKEAEKAAAAAAKNTGDGGGYTGTPGGNTGSGNFANIDNSGKNYGPYSNNNSSSGSYSNKGGGADMGGSSSPTNVGNPFGYMSGGRVYYMDGGLADMLEIYD